MLEPVFDAFAARHAAGKPCLVVARLIADLETPVSAYLKLAAGRRGRCFLLESIEGGAARGRYSMIGLDPDIMFRASAGQAEMALDALADPDAYTPSPEPPLQALRALLDASRIGDAEETLPPMAAGVFGYLGYDMVREMERLAPAKPDPIGVPDSLFMRPTIMVVFDTVRDEISVVTPARPVMGEDAHVAYAKAEGRIAGIIATLEGTLAHGAAGGPAGARAPIAPASNTSPERYLTMVARAKDYIVAPPATSSRWCCRSASRRRSPCPPSRSTAPCGGSIRRRFSATSISAASRSYARRRRSWSGCATGR